MYWWSQGAGKTEKGNIFALLPSAFTFYPIKTGDFVHIGAHTVLQATTVGSYVDIGRDCIIVSH